MVFLDRKALIGGDNTVHFAAFGSGQGLPNVSAQIVARYCRPRPDEDLSDYSTKLPRYNIRMSN